LSYVLGNFQVNGSSVQANSRIRYDTFTDIQSLKYVRPGTTRILEHFGWGNWSQSWIRSRFTLAQQHASKVDGLIFLLHEEVYKPSRTSQMPRSSVQGGYTIEGITIPSPSNEDNYLLALLQAWKKLCVRLGKKAVLCGNAAGCEASTIWDYIYGKPAMDYIVQNYDVMYVAAYPTSVDYAKGKACTTQYTTGYMDAKSRIAYLRARGFKKTIIYVMVTG